MDNNRIGALGICARWWGNSVFSMYRNTQKACATISTFNVGESWGNSLGKEGVLEELRKKGKQRENEAQGDRVIYVAIIPDTKQELPENAPL